MDNCSTHKGLQEVFDAKEYIPLFLSPYSPKFQPVELAFSKIKNSYRNNWPWNDSVETAVEESVQAVTSSDILGFFRHVGRQMAEGLR
jgi:transposase